MVLLNRARAARELPPLSVSRPAAALSRAHATAMAAADTLGSQNVTAALGALAAAAVAETVGTSFVPRGPPGGAAAAAAAPAVADGLVGSWLASPGTAALVVANYTAVGCGVAFADATTYASCLYARGF